MKDEVWRYSRIDRLDLDRFRPAGTAAADAAVPPSDRIHALVDGLGPRGGLVVTIDGVLATLASTVDDDLLGLDRAADHPDGQSLLGAVLGDAHDFPLLNDAFAVDPVVVDVRPGAEIADPVVIVHVVSGAAGAAVFPRTVVRVGEGASAGVIELVVDAVTGLLADGHTAWAAGTEAPAERLVVPVTELQVHDDASLAYVSIQSLGADTWQLAHQASTIGARATLSSYAVALGGGYARLRTDSALVGDSGTSRLRAAFIGRDDQMLDFRTLQDHRAPRTTSDLLFMGAVAETSHSVYSGLIRVRRGAVKTDAVQTNHNLVLDEGAHADSVPNLDIEENDVKCSHGSTVGPIDEDQRYYLESRGIEPERAEQLIVAGFFDSIADQVPLAGVRDLVGRSLAERSGVTRG
ncbi:MAG TPA: Fe-S cluster assembly protein SufD [Acidimicrobiales bacterium]|nr:Fe-S cluster assembly protein SufD [Acidimicrobiales bacterium]